jgi:hypothetical protein
MSPAFEAVPEHWFDRNLQRFLDDVVQEISATPTSEKRNLLTELQIMLMRVQDARKGSVDHVA